MEISTKKAAAVFKALGDENRLKILQLLATGEKCACKLLEQFQITQPTLSHHMKILCDTGLVVGRKEGKWMHYSISEENVRTVKQYFDFIVMQKQSELPDNKSCCEK